MIPVFVVIGSAYLVGSIPWGVLIGRAVGGVDIRQHGSGSMGATNALRTLGLRVSLIVLVLDVLKGVMAVVFSRWVWLLFFDRGWVYVGDGVESRVAAEVGAAIAVMVGHNWPIFAGFRGGKGVATYLGGTVTLLPVVGLLVFSIQLITIAACRYVSVGSMVGAIGGLVGFVFASVWLGYGYPYVAYGVISLGLIIVRHKANLGRIANGEEPRVHLGVRG